MVGIRAYECKEVKAVGPGCVTTGFGPWHLRFPSRTMELYSVAACAELGLLPAQPFLCVPPLRTGHGQPGCERGYFKCTSFYEHFCTETYEIIIITASKPEQ